MNICVYTHIYISAIYMLYIYTYIDIYMHMHQCEITEPGALLEKRSLRSLAPLTLQDRLGWWPREEIETFAADGVWCSDTTGLVEAGLRV